MTRCFLLLALGAAAQAQPLPLTWPARPEGAIISQTQDFDYAGAAVPDGAGGMIIAWADARDGDGRVVLQKFSGGPGDPGRWRSQLPGLGEAEGLFLPAAGGAAMMPWVVPDAAGGAVAVWQDLRQGTAVLRAQRAGDGPDGLGAPAWPQPVDISHDVLMPYDGCREERCRSVGFDQVKAACEDGAGGAWVAWRNPNYSLRLQHVEAGGGLDPDFPAEGLLLCGLAVGFALAADGEGRAVVAWQEYTDAGFSPVLVQGVRPDGTLDLPAGALPLAPAPVDYAPRFCLQTIGGGRVAAAWWQVLEGNGTSSLRVQLLDGSLAPLFEQGGLTVGSGYATDALYSASDGVEGPLYLVAHTGPPIAQQITLDGIARWGDGLPLDIVGDQQGLEPQAVAVAGGRLHCLLVDTVDDGSVGYVVALSDHGEPAWSEAQAFLSTTPCPSPRSGLVADAAGGTYCAWQALVGDQHQLQVRHRDAAAQDLLDSLQVVRRSSVAGYPMFAKVLPGAGQALVLWENQYTTLVQAVDPAGGEGLLGEGGIAPGLGRVDSGRALLADGEGGAWMAAVPVGGDTASTLHLCRLGAAGQVRLPLTPVVPGAAGQGDFHRHQHPMLVAAPDRIHVAFEELSPGYEVRVQALDWQGTPLWGEVGVAVGVAQAGEYAFLCELAADGQGGVVVVWSHYVSNVLHSYLQRFDEAGQPFYPDHEGRGLLLGDQYYGGADEARILPDPAGGLLLARTERFHSDAGVLTPSVFLTRLAPTGEIVRSERLSTTWYAGLDLAFTPEGLAAVAWAEADSTGWRVVVQHLDLDIDLVAEWRGGAAQARNLTDLHLLRGPGQPGLVTAGYIYDGQGECGLGGLRPAEAGGELVADYCGMPVPHPVNCQIEDLVVDAAGGAWCAWVDGRCLESGYGGQLRLLRLGGFDADLEPAVPSAPASFTLEPNHPNPFNPATWITFELGGSGPARLEVFNLAGQRVRVLAEGVLPAGRHRLRFDGRDETGHELASGLYFSRLTVGADSRAARMLLVR